MYRPGGRGDEGLSCVSQQNPVELWYRLLRPPTRRGHLGNILKRGTKMLKSSFIALSAAGMLTGVTLGMSGTAISQDMAATRTMYQVAVRVAELSLYMKQDSAQCAKIGPYIDAKAN